MQGKCYHLLCCTITLAPNLVIISTCVGLRKLLKLHLSKRDWVHHAGETLLPATFLRRKVADEESRIELLISSVTTYISFYFSSFNLEFLSSSFLPPSFCLSYIFIPIFKSIKTKIKFFLYHQICCCFKPR